MATNKSVSIIYVPSDCGSIIPGKSKAPKAFQSVGITKKLQDSGISVHSEQHALSQPATWRETTFAPGSVRNEALNVEVNQLVKRSVTESLTSTSSSSPPFLLILGGECSMLPGVLSGYWHATPPQQRVGLIYIDADTDLLSPTDPNSTGNLAAMTMAHLVFRPGTLASMKQFSRGPDGAPPCDPSNTVFFGVNMSSPTNTVANWTYLFDHHYKLVSSTAVAQDPEQRARETLAYLEGKVDVILVHLDVDAIDPGLFPLANVPNATGVEFAAMMSALRVFVQSPQVAGLTVAEVNPDHDPGLRMTGRLADGIVGALKERVGGRYSR